MIEGVFAVPAEPPLTTAADGDRPKVRVGVKKGSANDLLLTRTLSTQHPPAARRRCTSPGTALVERGTRAAPTWSGRLSTRGLSHADGWLAGGVFPKVL
ncbi:hypothetical protein [Nocardioides salarius]|uniref:hypothetical protein n=1 Tax=Nocardioides salarius TaxID=374513 RepID=UPI0030F7ACA8